MRYIVKHGTGGFHLNQSHKNPPKNSDEATSRWRSFAYKSEVMEKLLYEQYHLCCYTELRPDQKGLHYHIEHIENKKQNPQRTLDYANLAASALSSADLHNFQDEVFGGHAAGKRGEKIPVDMNRFISCHQPDCHRYFTYLLEDGRIAPSHALNAIEKDRAQYTIDLLHLNSPYLVAERKRWFEELDDLWFEHHEKSWSVEFLAQVYLVPCKNKLNPFFSLTRQFFEPIAEQTLRQHAPHLL